MEEEIQVELFNVLCAAGNASGLFYEALSAAKNDEFNRANKLFRDGEKILEEIEENNRSKLGGYKYSYDDWILILHVEDQFMISKKNKCIISNLIGLYKQLHKCKRYEN